MDTDPLQRQQVVAGGDARAAVDGDVPAQSGVHLAELVGRPEETVRGEVRLGRHVDGAGDVAGHRVHGLDLPPVPLRRPGVDQRPRRGHVLRPQHGHAARPDHEVAGCGPGRPDLARSTRRQPRRPAPVEHAHVVVTGPAQQPPAAGGGAAGPVVVHHDRSVAPHPGRAHRGLEVLRLGQRVPAAGAGCGGQVTVEVDVRRAGNVSRLELGRARRSAHPVAHVEHGDRAEQVTQVGHGDQRVGHAPILPVVAGSPLRGPTP